MGFTSNRDIEFLVVNFYYFHARTVSRARKERLVENKGKSKEQIVNEAFAKQNIP